DIFKAKASAALVQFFEICLCKATSIMVHADIQFRAAEVLREVNKAGITVFKDVVDQFLDHAEDNQLLVCRQPFAIVMKPAACIKASRAAYLLEEVVYGGFKAEVLKGRGHQAV